jgi:hypothetical protein
MKFDLFFFHPIVWEAYNFAHLSNSKNMKSFKNYKFFEINLSFETLVRIYVEN